VAASAIVELFATTEALRKQPHLAEAAAGTGARISRVTTEGLNALAQTQHPQGLVAVCGHRDVPLPLALARGPGLVAVLAEIRDPGNAGTILRTADAAGAQAVVFAGDAVDPYNGKCVRASAGSLFHVDVVRTTGESATDQLVAALRQAGLRVLATQPRGELDLEELADSGALAQPTAWLFGSEAHGLPPETAALADARVRIPIHGRAESLNLAAAAAICLYSSARARHPSQRQSRSQL
jgi:TrmH family RNA methyltransferase